MIGNFIGELKRRNVFRAATLYVGAVWVLSQGISELTGSLGLPEHSTQWFMIASAIGFPFWVTFSWFFELTSEGIKRESEITAEARSTRSNRTVDFIIIAVLALAVVLLVTDRVVEGDMRQPAPQAALATDNAIAVLPLENESGDKDQQYFSDGLSEGFIIALSRIDGLRVINRKSSFQFRDSKDDSRTIAAKLGVSHLLEGSVRRMGDTVRISATLTRAADGSTLWADSFDRPYKDLFALQDQITSQVAAALKSRLQPVEAHSQQGDRPPSGNLEAYDAYLAARESTDTKAAVKLFDRATELDPEYGLAYSMKARFLIDAVSGGLGGAEAEEAFKQAEAATKQAERVAANQASTRIARGYLLMLRDFDWRGSEAEFKRAVELAPGDGDALYWLGVVRANQGDPAQAVELTRKALATDPLNVPWHQWLAAYLMSLGKLDEAEQAIGAAIKEKPGAIYNHHLQTIVEVLRKDAAAAQKAAEAEPEGAWRDISLALAAQISPDRARADALLQDCIERYANGWAFQVAQMYAARGEPDAMFKWLERALKVRDTGMQSLLYDALLMRYRNDPRYAALVKQAGLSWPVGRSQASTGS